MSKVELSSERSRTTALLSTYDPGKPPSVDELFPVIYDELRRMAHRELAKLGGSTIPTTALVHEAYLKLVDDTKVSSNGRAYFFASAARAMRHVLVDRARHRNSKKRGSGKANLNINDVEIAVDDFASELLDLDEMLTKLAKKNARQARIVECRFFGGMTVEETAEALGVGVRTVGSDWALARSWLYRRLKE